MRSYGYGHDSMRVTTVMLVSVVLILSCATTALSGDVGDLGIFDFLTVLDLEQCLLKSYRCVPLGCGVTPPMDLICHNYPRGFVETPTAPFTTVVPFLSWVLSVVNSDVNPLGAGGSSGGSGDNHLKFFEAHVFDLPTRPFIRLRYPFLSLCEYENTFEINYLSEADEVSWRGILFEADYFTYDFLIGALAQVSQVCSAAAAASGTGDTVRETIPIGGVSLGDVCMGTWGVTYPRTGFSNVSSEPVGSGVAAYRASRIASKPIGRVVLLPKHFDPDAKMQLGYPRYGKPLDCFARGTTPALWDNINTTKLLTEKGYIWVLWQKTCCCMPSDGCLGLF